MKFFNFLYDFYLDLPGKINRFLNQSALGQAADQKSNLIAETQGHKYPVF